jgi:hypothetical protein
VGEAFQRFLVGSVRTPTSVEATMLIKKLQRNCLKLTRFRGPPTICNGGVRDVENETRLPP